jgi:hypothetical protein
MRQELRLLNALVGMAVSTPGWPSVLRDLGYELTALHPEVSLLLSGERRTVVPEAVFQSTAEHDSFVVESKSSTFDPDQARKYWALVASDLAAHGAIRDDGALDVTSTSPAYFCASSHTPHLQPQIEAFNDGEEADLPLVDHDNLRFELQIGTIRNPPLNNAFSTGIYFNEVAWPSRYVPFDAESPEEEYLSSVFNELRAVLMADERITFTASDLASGIPDVNTQGCVPFYDTMGNQARRRITGQIAAIVDELRRYYLPSYLTRLERGKWRTAQEMTTRRIGTVNDAMNDFILRKQEGRPLPTTLQTEQLIGEAEMEQPELPDSPA